MRTSIKTLLPVEGDLGYVEPDDDGVSGRRPSS